jgi:hypothetical protein
MTPRLAEFGKAVIPGTAENDFPRRRESSKPSFPRRRESHFISDIAEINVDADYFQ